MLLSRTSGPFRLPLGRKIVITNAFVKKSDKLPPSEKERALRAKADFEARVTKGTYYETD